MTAPTQSYKTDDLGDGVSIAEFAVIRPGLVSAATS